MSDAESPMSLIVSIILTGSTTSTFCSSLIFPKIFGRTAKSVGAPSVIVQKSLRVMEFFSSIVFFILLMNLSISSVAISKHFSTESLDIGYNNNDNL